MNFFILLYLFAIAPKILWDRIKKGKRHPAFLGRAGFKIPKISSKKPIWIHAVSVGEVKAAKPLFQELKKKYPGVSFLITTTSSTGQAEAKRSLKEADYFAYLPFDLSFIVKRWVKKIDPSLFLLIESDFWPNLLKALKKNETKLVLVSGKMSSRSFKRLSFFPRFAKKLFSPFDALCVQTEESYLRFLPFAPQERLHITGNLKLDLSPEETHPLPFPKPAITLSCTHFPEEELLLNALLEGPWFIFLAPRHPERFSEVASFLDKKKISYSLWTSPKPDCKVLLINAMGQLPSCYAHSALAILGGSFVPGIGGHNILEPILYRAPVFFGPYIFAQKELAQLTESLKAGRCVELEGLRKAVEEFVLHPQEMRNGVSRLMGERGGTLTKTISILKSVWE